MDLEGLKKLIKDVENSNMEEESKVEIIVVLAIRQYEEEHGMSRERPEMLSQQWTKRRMR